MYRFDHIVHFVESPEKAKEYFEREGIHTVMGGKHEAWGTYNALCYFDLSYIEFIGIFDEPLFVQAAKELHSLHASYSANHRQNGLTRFAIRTTSIVEDAKKFAQAGFEVNGPKSYSRTKEDGTLIRWQLLYIGHPQSKIDFPFFIQWDEIDATRRKQLTASATIANHPVGNLQLKELHIIVPNFTTVKQIATLCGISFETSMHSEDNEERMTVILPNCKLVFSRPIGEGEVWDILLEKGYGLYKARLTGGNEAKSISYEGAIYEFTT